MCYKQPLTLKYDIHEIFSPLCLDFWTGLKISGSSYNSLINLAFAHDSIVSTALNNEAIVCFFFFI